jgi:guanine deaminase
LITPLEAGGWRSIEDAVLQVDAAGGLARIADWATAPVAGALDVRPCVALPGLVDLHAHLPQLPHAGLGAGLDLLTWLDRYVFEYERRYRDETVGATIAPAAFRAFAAAGTTTAMLYASVFESSCDATFRAAEAHGIRAIIGKVMMDRVTYDAEIDPPTILRTSVEESVRLCERWHGEDAGRLRYAFTPRFAVSCTFQMLRESARLASEKGAYWQTHLSEDRDEMARVAQLFPDAADYTDVYEQAGGLHPNAVLAHAIHLDDDEVRRLSRSGARVAHCPASNLFLASGLMPLTKYLEAGLQVGIGSDVGAGPELSLFSVMRAGAAVQRAIAGPGSNDGILRPVDWLAMGTLHGARALGLGDVIGSLEVGKEADVILVDARETSPLPDGSVPDDPSDLVGRLIYRPHPAMVKGAWVRGRLLPAQRA